MITPSVRLRVFVDTTVQEKVIAQPVDSRLLDVARNKLVQAAKAAASVWSRLFAEKQRRCGDGPAMRMPGNSGGSSGRIPLVLRHRQISVEEQARK